MLTETQSHNKVSLQKNTEDFNAGASANVCTNTNFQNMEKSRYKRWTTTSINRWRFGDKWQVKI